MNFFSFNKTIQIRLILQFITSMATMTVTPYIILYFSTQLGTLVTGFMFIGVIIASMLGSIIGGFAADKLGRRKVILLAELVIFIGFICAAMANSVYFTLPYVTFILFVIIHFFSGTAEPAYQALILDVSSPENRRSIYTYSYWLRNLAISIGALIGAVLFFEYKFYLFLSVALCTFISLSITLIYIKDSYQPNYNNRESNDDEKKRKSTILKSFFNALLHVIKHKTFTAFVIASSLVISVEEQLTNYIAVRLAKQMNHPQEILSFIPFTVDGVTLLGILKTENTILVVILTLLITQLLKKWNDRITLLSGLLLYFIGYVIISYSTQPFILIMAMFLASLGEIIHIPAKQAILANLIPDDARGTYMAVYSLFSFIGISTAGIFLIVSGYQALSCQVFLVAWACCAWAYL